MTREEYLDFCMTCTKRKMDMRKGIVCSLTNEHANFENTCEPYEKDQAAEIQYLESKLASTGDHQSGHTYDYKKNIQNGKLAFFGGILLTIITYMTAKVTGISIFSYGVIIYGAVQYFRGKEQEKIMKKYWSNKEKRSSTE